MKRRTHLVRYRSEVFAYHQATSQLLYRRPSHHLIPRYQPCTLVLDTTPATFGKACACHTPSRPPR